MPLGAARASFTLAGGAKDMEMTVYMSAGGGGGSSSSTAPPGYVSKDIRVPFRRSFGPHKCCHPQISDYGLLTIFFQKKLKKNHQ